MRHFPAIAVGIAIAFAAAAAARRRRQGPLVRPVRRRRPRRRHRMSLLHLRAMPSHAQRHGRPVFPEPVAEPVVAKIPPRIWRQYSTAPSARGQSAAGRQGIDWSAEPPDLRCV